jgi:RES domain-containing protein
LSQTAFARAFREIPGDELRGFFFRGVPLKYVATPLSALGSKISGGRYNAANAFEVYYLAPNPKVALHETRAIRPRDAPKRIAPLVLFSVDCELQYVVDLTRDETLHALRVTTRDLTDEWRATVLEGKIPVTHDIGGAARTAAVEALIYPSARLPGASNLAVIVDRLRRDSRLRINPPDGFNRDVATEITGKR